MNTEKTSENIFTYMKNMIQITLANYFILRDS